MFLECLNLCLLEAILRFLGRLLQSLRIRRKYDRLKHLNLKSVFEKILHSNYLGQNFGYRSVHGSAKRCFHFLYISAFKQTRNL